MVDIKVPDLPESVDEATLLSWEKSTGDFVDRDEKIADVETDKVVLEVFATSEGCLNILKEEGAILKRGDIVCQISANEGSAAPTKKPSEPDEPATDTDNGEASALSPSVRKALNEMNVDSSNVTGTGKGGRITVADVKQAASNVNAPPATPPTTSASTANPPVRTSTKYSFDEDNIQRVPMTQIRRRISERLKEVQNTAAILTTFNEVNMQPVMDLRAKYKDRFLEEHGVKLGFMSFFVKATVEALKKFPQVNASIDERDLIYHQRFHIGIAVDSPRGLVVPVVRDADIKSFAEIESGIRELAGRAQEAKLQYEELIGGTFTITNGGVFGSMLSTPIINAPQSGILGMHSIQQRPVAENGEVVIRPMMYIALSYDHRIVDGRGAVQFLVSIKESLEDPSQLLLQI